MRGQKPGVQYPNPQSPTSHPLSLQFNDHQLLVQPDFCGMFKEYR